MIMHGGSFIPTVTDFPLQDAFRPVLTAWVAGLPSHFPGLIHCIYLYGSVARGQATPGESDLDITWLLSRWATDSELALDDYVGPLLAMPPDKAPEIDYLLAHAINNANDAEFTERMMDFLCWLEHQ